MNNNASSAPGVVLLFIDEDGTVIAQVSDFNRSGFGGYTLQEAQRWRANHQLCWEVAKAYASPQLVRGLADAHVRQIVTNLVSQHGCKVHEIVIGADEPEIAATVEVG